MTLRESAAGRAVRDVTVGAVRARTMQASLNRTEVVLRAGARHQDRPCALGENRLRGHVHAQRPD